MAASTRRLQIEQRSVAHAAELCAALSDVSVGRYIGGPEVTTVEAMAERIRYVDEAVPEAWGERWLNWVVRLSADATQPVIGRLEATVHIAREPTVAEIAYVFGPAWSGRGYATEATAWMLDHLRDEHSVAIVYATVDPANAASIRLLERLGFRPAEPPSASIGSYDAGDLVFSMSL